MSTDVHNIWSPNKLRRSNSIFNLWSDRKLALMSRPSRAVSLPATGCDVEGKCRHRPSHHRERPRPLGLVFLLISFFTCNIFSGVSTFHKTYSAVRDDWEIFFPFFLFLPLFIFFTIVSWSLYWCLFPVTTFSYFLGLSVFEFAPFIFSNVPLKRRFIYIILKRYKVTKKSQKVEIKFFLLYLLYNRRIQIRICTSN